MKPLIYVRKLLKRLKDEGIHTALQTSGFFKYSIFKKKLFPFLDLIMYDLKIIDTRSHFQHTPVDNQRILKNFLQLLKEDIEVIPRIPLVPGFTDKEKNVAGILDFIRENGVKKYSPFPYNPLGLSKWKHLGKRCLNYKF